MCSYSQVIEERGIEKGILIYRTLLETKSIQQTVAKTEEPADKVKKIAEQYQVEVLEWQERQGGIIKFIILLFVYTSVKKLANGVKKVWLRGILDVWGFYITICGGF